MKKQSIHQHEIRVEPDPIIDRVVEALIAPEVSFGCLDRDISQKELDLLQVTACLMTKTGTDPTEIMGCQSGNLTDFCFLFHHTPDDLRAEAATQDSASFVDRSKQNANFDSRGRHPRINSSFNPVWNRDGAYMAALANKIGNHPVLLHLPDIFNSQRRQLGTSETAAEENSERCVVPLAPKTGNVYGPQKTLSRSVVKLSNERSRRRNVPKVWNSDALFGLMVHYSRLCCPLLQMYFYEAFAMRNRSKWALLLFREDLRFRGVMCTSKNAQKMRYFRPNAKSYIFADQSKFES